MRAWTEEAQCGTLLNTATTYREPAVKAHRTRMVPLWINNVISNVFTCGRLEMEDKDSEGICYCGNHAAWSGFLCVKQDCDTWASGPGSWMSWHSAQFEWWGINPFLVSATGDVCVCLRVEAGLAKKKRSRLIQRANCKDYNKANLCWCQWEWKGEGGQHFRKQKGGESGSNSTELMMYNKAHNKEPVKMIREHAGLCYIAKFGSKVWRTEITKQCAGGLMLSWTISAIKHKGKTVTVEGEGKLERKEEEGKDKQSSFSEEKRLKITRDINRLP